jgi:hypothetical protein
MDGSLTGQRTALDVSGVDREAGGGGGDRAVRTPREVARSVPPACRSLVAS